MSRFEKVLKEFEKVLERLPEPHQSILRRLVTAPPPPLEPHEQAALDEFREVLKHE